MKVRVFVIEADELDAGDLRELLSQFSTRPTLTPQPAAPVTMPPAIPTAIVKSQPGWRPQRKRENTDPQPKTAVMVQCAECGADLPEGADRRSKCTKCGRRAWEEIPARGNPVIDEDEE